MEQHSPCSVKGNKDKPLHSPGAELWRRSKCTQWSPGVLLLEGKEKCVWLPNYDPETLSLPLTVLQKQKKMHHWPILPSCLMWGKHFGRQAGASALWDWRMSRTGHISMLFIVTEVFMIGMISGFQPGDLTCTCMVPLLSVLLFTEVKGAALAM